MTEPKLKEKRWNKDIELELLKQWEEKYDFSFDSSVDKPCFSVDTPPPYPSGAPHPGQMVHYPMIDVFARSMRMAGYNVLFPMGLDRNGINIEKTVEKKYNKSLHEFDREEFIDLCRKEIDA